MKGVYLQSDLVEQVCPLPAFSRWLVRYGRGHGLLLWGKGRNSQQGATRTLPIIAKGDRSYWGYLMPKRSFKADLQKTWEVVERYLRGVWEAFERQINGWKTRDYSAYYYVISISPLKSTPEIPLFTSPEPASSESSSVTRPLIPWTVGRHPSKRLNRPSWLARDAQ